MTIFFFFINCTIVMSGSATNKKTKQHHTTTTPPTHSPPPCPAPHLPTQTCRPHLTLHSPNHPLPRGKHPRPRSSRLSFHRSRVCAVLLTVDVSGLLCVFLFLARGKKRNLYTIFSSLCSHMFTPFSAPDTVLTVRRTTLANGATTLLKHSAMLVLEVSSHT